MEMYQIPLGSNFARNTLPEDSNLSRSLEDSVTHLGKISAHVDPWLFNSTEDAPSPNDITDALPTSDKEFSDADEDMVDEKSGMDCQNQVL